MSYYKDLRSHLEALEERGELNETLILFMSDHGDMDGDHRMVSKQSSFYEEVMRLPAIIHWPAGIVGGQRISGLVEANPVLQGATRLLREIVRGEIRAVGDR